MKIYSVGAAYPAKGILSVQNTQTSATTENTDLKGFTKISFKGGNPNHVAHWVMEEPDLGAKGGGVGTVSKDYNTLNVVNSTTQGKTVKFMPYYNGKKTYDKSGELVTDVQVHRVPNNLPDEHPLRGKEGTPFFTMQDLDKNSISDILKDDRNYFLLDEVKSTTMEWGLQKDAKIGLYKVRPTKALESKNPGVDFFLVFTDATASMTKPYADGSYSSATELLSNSWNGDAYAKASKACQKLMQYSQDSVPGFDPKHIICSDGQAAYLIQNAAIANANGEPYWKDKFLSEIGHNLGDGYIQGTSAKSMIVNLGATPEQIEKIINSPEYMNALMHGEEEAFLKKTVLKDFLKGTDNVNAMSIPIYYAKKDYVPMFTTVSEGYYETLLKNKEITPALYDDLVELNRIGKFKGLTNPLNDPSLSPFVQVGMNGYKNEHKIKLADGTETIVKPFITVDKNKTSLSDVREIKRLNKINLFERLNEKFKNSFAYKPNGELGKAGSGLSLITAGSIKDDFKVHGAIDKVYVDKLNKGEDVKLIVSWGRGDFQKAMDTVMDAFEKYADKDPNAVLVMGGPLDESTPDYKIITEKIKQLNENPKVKGRFVYMQGFAPGTALASAADVSMLPSRTAPCELTDLEAKKKLCTPIVTKAQGLDQKNFDTDVAEEAKFADAFKTKHEFYTPVEECLRDGVAPEEAKDKFLKRKDEIEKELSLKYKLRTGKEITPELLEQKLTTNSDYQKIVKDLRDSVVADELVECLDRALNKYRNGETAEKILKNQVNMDTTWEGNGWLSKTNRSSAELYREYHINNNGKNLSKDDLIKLDFTEFSEGSIRNASKDITFGQKIKKFLHSKSGKWTTGITAAAVVAGAGYALLKSEKPEPKPENEHLSAVV
jgi:glycosyltransferase involved in cell wall biosynthesis